MIEFLNENIGLFLLLLGIVIIVFLVRLAIQSNALTKSLVTKKFSFENLYETDKQSGENEFTLIIANKTLNDTSITDVGFMLWGQTFSYVNEFRAQNGFVSGDKATVSQRSSLRLTVSVVDLESMLFMHKRSAKIKKLRAYVVDSSGFMVSAPIKRIQKIIREDYKSMLYTQSINRIEDAKNGGEKALFSDKIKRAFTLKKHKRVPPVLVEQVVVLPTVVENQNQIENVEEKIEEIVLQSDKVEPVTKAGTDDDVIF